MGLLGQNLETFMAIVRHKTVNSAAGELKITQTAVTQRIRTLEKMLNTTLFRRSRSGMLLTPEGEILLHYCHATSDLAKDTVTKIQGTGVDADISVSITGYTSIMRSRVIPQCIHLLKKFPRLLFDFKIDDSDLRKLTLRSGESDFAILRKELLTPEMKCKELEPERYVLVGPYKWRNRRLKDIIKKESIVDFDETDQVTFNYLKKYNLFDISNHRRHFASRTADLALLASEGVGYSGLSKTFAQPFLKSKKIVALNQGKTLDYHPVLAWYDRPQPPAYFSAIIDAIK